MFKINLVANLSDVVIISHYVNISAYNTKKSLKIFRKSVSLQQMPLGHYDTKQY